MSSKLRLAMFVSGSGTTAEAIWNTCQRGLLVGIEPVLLVSSQRSIGAIERLTRAGLPDEQMPVLDRREFETGEAYGERILSILKQWGIDQIGLYGWMPLLPADVVETYRGRSTNQHPGILDPPRPDFGGSGMYGMRVHWAAHYFAHHNPYRDFFFTAATAQRVAVGYDKGEVIEEETMLFDTKETPEQIRDRLLPVEHRTQIRVLQRFTNGNVGSVRRMGPVFAESEIPILTEARRLAKLAYPRG